MKKYTSLIIRWAITLLIVAVLVFIIWKFMINRTVSTYEKPLEPVKVEKAQRGELEQVLKLSGYINASDTVPVVSFVSGTLDSLDVKEGQWIEKDQVIAAVDPEPYKLQSDQAEAVYLAAKATFERVSALYKANAATKQNYDEAKAQYDAYKAQYDLANVQLGYTEIKAPVSGTVLSVEVSQSSPVSQGTCVAVIADLSSLEITLDVPETYYETINRNQGNISATISRSSSSYTSPAYVSTVSPYVNPQSRTFGMTFTIGQSEAVLKPGMFVTVSLVYNRLENSLLLPWRASCTDGTVYAYNEEKQCAQYLGNIAVAEGSEYFAIPDEYENTLFIVEGQNSVLDGQKVSVI